MNVAIGSYANAVSETKSNLSVGDEVINEGAILVVTKHVVAGPTTDQRIAGHGRSIRGERGQTDWA